MDKLVSVRSFLASFLLTSLLVATAAWLSVLYLRPWFMDPELAKTAVNSELTGQCKANQLVFLGDSDAVADVVPNLIGPHVSTLGLGGGGAVEIFYTLRHLLKRCPDAAPKAIILIMNPFKVTGPEGHLWDRSMLFGSLSNDDIEDFQKNISGKEKEALFGPESFLSIDTFLKEKMYALRFPTYYFPSFFSFISEGIHSNSWHRRKNAYYSIYDKGITDRGHIFYGQDVGLDLQLPEWWRKSSIYSVRNIQKQYLEKISKVSKEYGIELYFISAPILPAFLQQGKTGFLQNYSEYIRLKATQGDWKLLGKALSTLPNEAWGDSSHLNAHGSFWFSYEIFNYLKKYNRGLVWRYFGAPQSSIKNSNISKIWSLKGEKLTVSTDSERPPETLYPVNDRVRLLSSSDAENHSEYVNTFAPITLTPDYYTSSIFVKNGNANMVRWHFQLPESFNASVVWDFKHQKIYRYGNASNQNSGVERCSNGWIRLWIQGKDRVLKESRRVIYSDASLSIDKGRNLKVFGATLERGSDFSNDCVLGH